MWPLKKSASTPSADKKERFIQDAKDLEQDFLSFLNVALDVAQKQPNQQHKEILANFTQTLGELIQILLRSSDLGAAKKMFLLPKILGLIAEHEKANTALGKVKDQIVDLHVLENAFAHLGNKMKTVMDGYTR